VVALLFRCDRVPLKSALSPLLNLVNASEGVSIRISDGTAIRIGLMTGHVEGHSIPLKAISDRHLIKCAGKRSA